MMQMQRSSMREENKKVREREAKRKRGEKVSDDEEGEMKSGAMLVAPTVQKVVKKKDIRIKFLFTVCVQQILQDMLNDC